MSRISQYPLDTNIEGNDKWIGTSVNNANATKNFSVDNVIEYINKSGGVDSQNLRYTYQNVQGDDVRLASTISFTPSLSDNVPFVGITEWVISAFSKQVKDVRTYYNAPLIGSTILITNAFNPSNWAIFRWNSVTEDILDPNFYTIGLTHIQSTGELVANQDYLIALLDAASDGSAYWGAITGTLSNQTDLQNALNAKQPTLVSGTNIKTINSTTILGSGNIAVQSTLVSGTNIQSINSSSILTSGNINLQVPLVSGTNIKTINSTTLLGSGDVAVQPTLVSGTNIKTINSTSLLGSGNIVIATLPSGVAGAIQFSNGSVFSSDATNFFWDNTNKRLGIGASTNPIRSAIDVYNYATPPILTVSSQKAFDVADSLIGGIQGIQHPTLTAPSTAIYFKSEAANSAQGKITFLTGSALGSISEKMVIGFGGNVGIGESAPTARLQVKGSGATSATTSLLVQNSSLTNLLTVKDDGGVSMGNTLITSAISNSLVGSLTVQNTTPYSAPNYNQLSQVWLNSGGGILGYFRNDGRLYTSNDINSNYFVGNISGSISAPVFGVGSNGLFFPSSDIAFTTSSTEKMRITSAGNVGIGETSPTARLQVKGSGATSATNSLIVQNSAGTELMNLDNGGTLNFANPTNIDAINISGYGRMKVRKIYGGDYPDNYLALDNFSINYNGGYTNGGHIFKVNSSEVFRIDSTGNVGIGTTSPTARLQVKGSGSTSSTTSLLVQNSTGNNSITTTDDGSTIIYSNLSSSTAPLIVNNQSGWSGAYTQRLQTWRSAGVDKCWISGAGSMVIGEGCQALTFTSAQPSSVGDVAYRGSGQGAGNGLYFPTANATGIATNGIERMRVNASGDLGIGESSPTARLQVKGSGSTSATNSLLIQNSGASDLLKLQDNGNLYLGNSTLPTASLNLTTYGGAYTPRLRLRNAALQDTGGPDGTEIMSVSGSFYADSDSYGGIKLLTQTNWLSSQLAFYTGGYSGSGTKQMTLRNDGSLVVSTSAHLPSAKLQVDSTTQGLLPPRMTTTQRNAIATPATGLIVYDTTLLSLYQYNGTAWAAVGGGGGTPSGVAGAVQFSNGSAFASDAANFFFDDTNNRLGVGINAPTATLHSKGSGNTGATSTLKLENSTASRSLLMLDSGDVTFYNSVTQKMAIIGYESALTFQSSSGNIITENGIQFQAGGGQLFDGTLYLSLANYTHLFRKNIQLDGTITPNTAFQTVFNDGGGTFTNTYRMVNITPTIVLSGSGSKNVVGLTFNPTLTSTTNTRVFGAVFESGNMLIGGVASSGNASASLEVISTTQGLLPPRMTTVQVLAIVTPAAGLMVYNTTLATPCFYDGTAWRKVSHTTM